jgi:hypothetical protein
MKNGVLLSIWAFFCPILLFAQKKGNPDSLLMKQFDAGAKLEWKRTYLARLDDITTLQLHLGYDGKNCNGWGRFGTDGAIFPIQGVVNDQNLFLVELDQARMPVSTIEARMESRKLTGERILVGRKSAQKLTATVATGKDLANHAEENKWYRRYNAKWNDRATEITLTRLQGGMVMGQIWLPESSIFYRFEGRVGADGKFSAPIEAIAQQKTIGTIKANLESSPKISFTIEQSGTPKTYLHAALVDQWEVDCFQEANDRYTLDAVTPRTKSEQLNALLDQKLQSWVAQMKGSAAASPKNAPLLATAWTTITCWQDELVCAVFHAYNPVDTSWHSESLIFQTKKKKQIAVEDLFQERFDYQTWFKAQTLKNIPGIEAYEKDKSYQKWLDQTGFPVVYLRADGMVLSTLFHPVYGTNEILLPWATVKPYLRPQSALKGMVK